jgi:hypothetical protein
MYVQVPKVTTFSNQHHQMVRDVYIRHSPPGTIHRHQQEGKQKLDEVGTGWNNILE